jgi:hypothetical protein
VPLQLDVVQLHPDSAAQAADVAFALHAVTVPTHDAVPDQLHARLLLQVVEVVKLAHGVATPVQVKVEAFQVQPAAVQ